MISLWTFTTVQRSVPAFSELACTIHDYDYLSCHFWKYSGNALSFCVDVAPKDKTSQFQAFNSAALATKAYIIDIPILFKCINIYLNCCGELLADEINRDQWSGQPSKLHTNQLAERPTEWDACGPFICWSIHAGGASERERTCICECGLAAATKS